MKPISVLRSGAAILSVCLLLSASAFADTAPETPIESLSTESEVFRIESEKTNESTDKVAEESVVTNSEDETLNTFTIRIARSAYIFTGPGNEFKKIQAIVKGETYTAFETLKSKTGFDWYRIVLEDGTTDAYIPAIATIPEPERGSGSTTQGTTPGNGPNLDGSTTPGTTPGNGPNWDDYTPSPDPGNR